MPPALFALVILEIRSCFFPRLAWNMILLFQLPVTYLTGTYHHAQLFSIEMGYGNGIWPGTMVLWISISQVARFTGMNCRCQAQ
jgi:hypothetical protein